METVETIDMDAALSAPLTVQAQPAPAGGFAMHANAALPAVQQPRAVATTRSRDDMMLAAMERGYSAEQIERFMDVRDRQHRFDSECSFNEAFAEFKKNPPRIVKNKHVSYRNSKGGLTEYDHASHAEVTNKIAAALALHGISHSFSTEQANGRIKVTCTLSHKGYARTTSMEAAYDDSGGKNAIQAIGSARLYLERYTLLGITGLSTEDDNDDDGRSTEGSDDSVIGKVFDNLCAQAEMMTVDAEALKVWTIGNKLLHALGAVDAVAEFKDRVACHRKALAAKVPA